MWLLDGMFIIKMKPSGYLEDKKLHVLIVVAQAAFRRKN